MIKDEILSFKQEFLDNDEIISGGELLDHLDFDEWLSYVEKNSNISTVSSDWVLTDVFFASEDGRILGVISFRHRLNEFLRDWGHIGYSVRPSERRRGVATFMLKSVILFAKSIGLSSLQLSCYDDNVASKKIIVSSGGVFVRSFIYLNHRVNVYVILLNDEFRIDCSCN